MKNIKAAMLIQHGGNDKRLVDGWPAYEAALKAAGVRYEGYVYPNAEHGFNNDTTPRYDAAAAKLAWETHDRALQQAPALSGTPGLAGTCRTAYRHAIARIVEPELHDRPVAHQEACMDSSVTREDLLKGLQEDLSREYQAIIAYVVYSQALKGAQYMSIAKELEVHAGEELQHAITIAKQIDYLGGMPNATALPVKLSEDAETMLRADLQNENDTVRAYRERVRQCDALGEFAMSEQIREILIQEQEHQIDLATALGEDVQTCRR